MRSPSAPKIAGASRAAAAACWASRSARASWPYTLSTASRTCATRYGSSRRWSRRARAWARTAAPCSSCGVILVTSSIGRRPPTTWSASGSTASVSDSPASARSVPMSARVRAALTFDARNGSVRPVDASGVSNLSRASENARAAWSNAPCAVIESPSRAALSARVAASRPFCMRSTASFPASASGAVAATSHTTRSSTTIHAQPGRPRGCSRSNRDRPASIPTMRSTRTVESAVSQNGKTPRAVKSAITDRMTSATTRKMTASTGRPAEGDEPMEDVVVAVLEQ